MLDKIEPGAGAPLHCLFTSELDCPKLDMEFAFELFSLPADSSSARVRLALVSSKIKPPFETWQTSVVV